jgi:hypothetical protein
MTNESKSKSNNGQCHDKYGKEVLKRAFGSDFNPRPKPFKIGADTNAGSIRLDGEIYGEIAVEIESRVSKQVRGAILDLFLHPYKKKLLVIIDMHGNKNTSVQSEEILRTLCGNKLPFIVITLNGNGYNSFIKEDIVLVKNQVKKLNLYNPIKIDTDR